MKKLMFALLLFMLVAGTAEAQQSTHPCAKDATKRGSALLRLHFADGGEDKNFKGTVSDDVKLLAPVRALKGNGRFDVLEVRGYIYKAEYRMRFIYAQIKGSCALMGQEILEASDPY